MSQDGHIEYRTDVLSLAVYLNLEGHCHQRLEMRDGSAVWVFLATDELVELVNDFQLGVATVEPREYIEQLAKHRRGLFTFLDQQKAING